MKTTFHLNLFFFLVGITFQGTSQITTLSSNAGNERDDAIAFSIGEFGYFLTGNQGSSTYSQAVLRLDNSTKTWDSIGEFPGEARQYSTAFSIADKAYLVGGISISGTPLNDVWEFSATTNSWVQLAAFPGEARWGMSSTSIGEKGYVLGGTIATQTTNEFWEFNALNQQWTQLTNKPGSPIREGTLGVIHGELFSVGGFKVPGVQCVKEVYAYSIIKGSWKKVTDFPSIYSGYLSGVSYNGKIYVANGWHQTNTFSNMLWEFDGENWTLAALFPEPGIRGMSAFSIKNDLFFVSGLRANLERSSTTYTYKVNETPSEEVLIYPNPAQGIIYIESSDETRKLAVYNLQGQFITEVITRYPLSSLTLPAGYYTLFDATNRKHYPIVMN